MQKDNPYQSRYGESWEKEMEIKLATLGFEKSRLADSLAQKASSSGKGVAAPALEHAVFASYI